MTRKAASGVVGAGAPVAALAGWRRPPAAAQQPTVLALQGDVAGVHDPAVIRRKDAYYLFFHAYQGTTGRSYLQISTMVWENGWPRVSAPP